MTVPSHTQIERKIEAETALSEEINDLSTPLTNVFRPSNGSNFHIEISFPIIPLIEACSMTLLLFVEGFSSFCGFVGGIPPIVDPSGALLSHQATCSTQIKPYNDSSTAQPSLELTMNTESRGGVVGLGV
jgi:hypothetical protein